MYRSKTWSFNVADILRSMSDAIVTIDAEERITSMNAASGSPVKASGSDAER